MFRALGIFGEELSSKVTKDIVKAGWIGGVANAGVFALGAKAASEYIKIKGKEEKQLDQPQENSAPQQPQFKR